MSTNLVRPETGSRSSVEPVPSDREELIGGLSDLVDERTLRLIERRKGNPLARRRGWLIRRMLLVADIVGLTAAFVLAAQLFGHRGAPIDDVAPAIEFAIFLATLPVWILMAKIYGLYDRDEERADYSSADEAIGVFHVVSAGTWAVFATSWVTELAQPNPPRLIAFWLSAVLLVAAGRAIARTFCRRSIAYLQNTVIVGAGDIGQLVARKLLLHPEYGINLVGFVDDRPKERRGDLEHLALLGPPEVLPSLIPALDIERVVVAFSNDSHARTLELLRSLKAFDVQVDLVPRLFEIVGPNVGIHTVEGLPLIGLPPTRMSPRSRLVKRTIDVIGAAIGLVLVAPLFAYIAWRIRRESPGPVFFRQTRVGENMREFTALKFRTMAVDTDDTVHRDYIRNTMQPSAPAGRNGLYKLEREDAITPFGRRLRCTSLDELPQLLNVLRGDMSLVGPRPCLPYELEHFAPHHYERFDVPAGLTGLWQVTARARSTFGEALDMDVVYARGWSLALDLRLLFRTPSQVLRKTGTA